MSLDLLDLAVETLDLAIANRCMAKIVWGLLAPQILLTLQLCANSC